MTAGKRRLMVVEDSPDIQLLLRKLFEREGYEVICASNGQQALDLLNNCADLPHAIFLDLMMPVMDGFVFRQEMLKNERLAGIPVIVMSADGDVERKRKIVDVEIYVRKPVDIGVLLEAAKKYA